MSSPSASAFAGAAGAPPKAGAGGAGAVSSKQQRAGEEPLLAGAGGDFAYGTSVATCAVDVRLGFLRKVYGILAAQLALTTALCAVAMLVAPVRRVVLAANGALVMLGFIGSIATLFGLMAAKDSFPLNMRLLAAFTVFESMLVATVCAQYAAAGMGYLVLEALALTLTIFTGLTVYCLLSKKDFSFMGGALYAGLMCLIGASVVNLILGFTGGKSTGLAFLISWGGAMLFTLFILYDTSLLMHRLSPDEYIFAAISLYLDILNLFLYILQILTSRQD